MENRRPDARRIGAYYDRLVNAYGHSPLACDASAESSLAIRYRVLSEVSDLTDKRVLEVGCGFGDLGAHLVNRYAGVSYCGIDVSGRMIEVGRSVHPTLDLRHADVLDWDPVDEYDVVLAQGIFYLLGQDAEAKTSQLISRMFELAGEALAFCTISSWATKGDPGEFRPDPLRTVAFCKQLTTRLVLRHDYLPNDFAIYAHRASAATKGLDPMAEDDEEEAVE
jgi:SAM-dependent methyltransferase